MDINLPIYDGPKIWISNSRKREKSWDEINNGMSHLPLCDFLSQMADMVYWPVMTPDEWHELVAFMKNQEDSENRANEGKKSSIITDTRINNSLYVPTDEGSAWQKYKKLLLEVKHYNPDSVRQIEDSCLKTLRCLSTDTPVDDPRKGLVVGNVQSGKTGHMAGLISMAADWGWNMFIIFSGSIENLRVQTENRIISDLRNGSDTTWIPLPRPKKNGNIQAGYALQDIVFKSNGNPICYLTICLKNSTRIKNLLDWLNSDPNNRGNLKVLVIDDEADQASINTSTEDERTKINGGIINIVSGNDKSGNKTKGYHGMNYVAYTATPYANLLNESSSYSLYPKDFITSLTTPKEYFGPQQIFGTFSSDEYEGLNIVREIAVNEVDTVKDIQNGGAHLVFPKALQDSICWFLCGVACRRRDNSKKPVSMLVHTSMRTTHHTILASLISNWFKQKDKNTILGLCKTKWEYELGEFTIDDFKNQYPDYTRMDSVKDYPAFEEILPFLEELLDNRISQIPIDEDGNLEYHKGIHLCIDNGSEGYNDDNEKVRLIYPEKDLDFAPAFIVVGGNTLSRGLTIEGLLSTYFFRVVKLADTLMQMGRWFGYRVGYELLPRIWMTRETKTKFEYLSKLDEELRLDIVNMERRGATPSDYAVRLLNSPANIRITSPNRMQSVEAAEMDFSGTLLQTFIFDENVNVLQHNLDVTESFLTKLSSPDTYNSQAKSSLIWRGVEFSLIKDYLTKYIFNEKIRGFNDLEALLIWIEDVSAKGYLEDWSVVLCSIKGDDSTPEYTVNGTHKVKKINRTRRQGVEEGLINIGVLTNPTDFIADLDMDRESQEIKDLIKNTKGSDSRAIRSESLCKKRPQLLIYIVDKDSASNTKSRDNLNAKTDIVGVAINVPGHDEVRDHTRVVRIKLEKLNTTDTVD